MDLNNLFYEPLKPLLDAIVTKTPMLIAAVLILIFGWVLARELRFTGG